MWRGLRWVSGIREWEQATQTRVIECCLTCLPCRNELIYLSLWKKRWVGRDGGKYNMDEYGIEWWVLFPAAWWVWCTPTYRNSTALRRKRDSVLGVIPRYRWWLIARYNLVGAAWWYGWNCGFDPLLHLLNTNKNITMGYLVEILNIAVLSALCMYGYLVLIAVV